MLSIGYVGVVRPLFRGDAPGAARASLAGLEALGRDHDFRVVTPQVTGNVEHVATGTPIPDFAVSDRDTAEQAARQLAEAGVDLLLVQHTTFSTGEVLVPLLHACERIGLWALPEAAGGAAEGPLPLNALCGLNMTLSFLDHPSVAKPDGVTWLYGNPDDAWFLERFLPTLAALRGLRAVSGARILAIGGTAPAFYGLEERPRLPAVTVDDLPLAELFERVAAVPEQEAAAAAEAWAARETLETPRAQLLSAARIERALTGLAREGDYQALAVRCWPELPDACGAMACAAVGRLGDARMPAACEGDVMGALSMLALQGVSGAPGILMDLSDLDRSDDTLQLWHCGNAPLGWARGRGGTRLTTHFNRRETGVVRDMTLREGPATILRLLDGGRRAMIAGGRFLGGEKRGFDGVRGWLGDLHWNGRRVDVKGFVSEMLDRRLPHHLALGDGEHVSAVRTLCGWLGAEPLAPPVGANGP